MAIRQRFVGSVTLDGSGNGTVEITARGDFLLLRTRWKITGENNAALVNQAQATNLINGHDFEGTYSGNDDQSGSAELLEAGDTLTCRWTGGDPGARATLTLRGIEYPAGTGMQAAAGGMGAGGGGPGNPVLGGTTLIRDAIQSSNYEAGVSGWTIRRDGSYELGPAGEIRGDLTVDSPSGAYVKIFADASFAEIDMQPGDSTSPAPAPTWDYARLFTDSNGDAPVLKIFGPKFTTRLSPPSFSIGEFPATGQTQAVIEASRMILGSIAAGATFDVWSPSSSFLGDVRVDGTLTDSGGFRYFPGYYDQVSITIAAGTTNTVQAVVFPTAFPAGVIPCVFTNIVNGSGASILADSRAEAPTNTGFNMRVKIPTAPGANLPLTVQYIAFKV